MRAKTQGQAAECPAESAGQAAADSGTCPALFDLAPHPPQAQASQMHGREERAWLPKNWYVSCAEHLPARVPEQRPCPLVAGARIEAPQGLFSAEAVKLLGSVTPRVAIGRGAIPREEDRKSALDLVRCGGRVFRRFDRRRRLLGVVQLLDGLKDELIAVARHRADEARLARVVAESAPEASHGLGQSAFGDHHV